MRKTPNSPPTTATDAHAPLPEPPTMHARPHDRTPRRDRTPYETGTNSQPNNDHTQQKTRTTTPKTRDRIRSQPLRIPAAHELLTSLPQRTGPDSNHGRSLRSLPDSNPARAIPLLTFVRRGNALDRIRTTVAHSVRSLIQIPPGRCPSSRSFAAGMRETGFEPRSLTPFAP